MSLYCWHFVRIVTVEQFYLPRARAIIGSSETDFLHSDLICQLISAVVDCSLGNEDGTQYKTEVVATRFKYLERKK